MPLLHGPDLADRGGPVNTGFAQIPYRGTPELKDDRKETGREAPPRHTDVHLKSQCRGKTSLARCGRRKDGSPEDVPVLTPEPRTMPPDAAKGAL